MRAVNAGTAIWVLASATCLAARGERMMHLGVCCMLLMLLLLQSTVTSLGPPCPTVRFAADALLDARNIRGTETRLCFDLDLPQSLENSYNEARRKQKSSADGELDQAAFMKATEIALPAKLFTDPTHYRRFDFLGPCHGPEGPLCLDVERYGDGRNERVRDVEVKLALVAFCNCLAGAQSYG